MRILLLEDEAPAARRLMRMVAKVAPQAEVVAALPSVEEALAWLDQNPAPDLFLADIELADGRSFDLFRQRPPESAVIFTTAYDAYALQAFEHNGIAYLLKPIEEANLRNAFDRVERLRRPGQAMQPLLEQRALQLLIDQMAVPARFRNRFLLRFGDRYLPLEVQEVAYFAAEGKGVLAYTHDNRRLPLDQPLDQLEAELDTGRFFRVSRGIITCRGAIKSIVAHFNGRLKLTLQPAAADEVYVSRERAQLFRDWMSR